MPDRFRDGVHFKITYAIGVAEGQQFKNFGFEFSEKILLEGINDALAGKEKYTQEELQGIFQILQQKMEAKMMKDVEAEKEKGLKFLSENRKKKGVIETESGLQYEVIKIGRPRSAAKHSNAELGRLSSRQIEYPRGKHLTLLFHLNKIKAVDSIGHFP